MFFFISGFIITALLIREYRAKGEIAIANFYVRRLLRLYLALAVFVAVIALCYAIASKPIDGLGVTSSLLYFRSYVQIAAPERILPQCHHLWSLASRCISI